MHFLNPIVSDPARTASPTVVDLVNEINYIERLVGIDYVALGPDYFPSSRRPEDKWLNGARNMREMEGVALEMVKQQYRPVEIKKVLGLNFEPHASV